MPVRIGELLLKEKRISAEQLQEALTYQRTTLCYFKDGKDIYYAVEEELDFLELGAPPRLRTA